MSLCPECGGGLYHQTRHAWRCQTCGHTEARRDQFAAEHHIRFRDGDSSVHEVRYGSELCSLARFKTLREEDVETALLYVELGKWEGRDALNAAYLAAKLALETGQVSRASKFLGICLEQLGDAAQPKLVADLEATLEATRRDA